MCFTIQNDFLRYGFLCVLICLVLPVKVLSQAQSGTIITVSIDAGEGLIYLLLVIFFAVNFCTPVIRYVYVSYLANLVEKAQQQAVKASKKMTERMSDAGRKVSQSVRSV
jgi:hypothetical protein